MTPAASAGAALSPEHEAAASAAAASTLFERHRPRVYAFCVSRTRNPTDAEDATQTTFMHALSGLRRGVVPEFELGWLLRIAENVCHSMRRRAHRRYERDQLPFDLAGEAAGDPAVVSERMETLSAALEALPETQRRALVLREWRGLSYDDIAAELQTSHAAVETLLFRARRSLAQRVASVAGAGLNVLPAARVVRSLLGTGIGKATAVSAAAITIGATVSAAGPASVVDRPQSPDNAPAVAVDAGAEPGPRSGEQTPARAVADRADEASSSPASPPAPAPGGAEPQTETSRPTSVPAAGQSAPSDAWQTPSESGDDPTVAVPAPVDGIRESLEPIAVVPEIELPLLALEPVPVPEPGLLLPPIELAPVITGPLP